MGKGSFSYHFKSNGAARGYIDRDISYLIVEALDQNLVTNLRNL